MNKILFLPLLNSNKINDMETLTITYNKRNTEVKKHLEALFKINGVKIYDNDTFLTPDEIQKVEKSINSEIYPISNLKEKYIQ